MTTLNTDRLTLRHFKSSDAASVYHYASNPKIGPIAGWPVHQSEAESRFYIENYFMSPHIFAITLKSNPDDVIGLVGLELADEGNAKDFMTAHQAEISYWIGEPFWGQGLVPEAIAAVIDYGFNTLHLTDIWCGYKDGNEQSKRAQEKQGFRYERTIHHMYNPVLDEEIIEHFTILHNPN